MNFSTLFRLRENLNLDKKTLVILRWIAIIGQFTTVNLVYFYLKLDFPVVFAHLILFCGFLTNSYLQFGIRSITIKDFYASIFLIYDLLQLTALLYLTGGISNPFSILMIIPTIVSSTFLSMGTTIVLGILTIIFLFVLTIFHYPLPGIHDHSITFPKLYLTGYFLAIIVGLVFLSYFGIRFSGESKRRSDAINKVQQVIAKEYELESLGGQAAAAAHSLGTPLATINVVASELKKELGKNNCASIASNSASSLYDIPIIKQGIENNSNNYTRFLVFSKDNRVFQINNEHDKTSIIFSVKHEPGSLYQILKQFGAKGINLTKIESRPNKNTNWEYNFFVDFIGNVSDQESQVKELLNNISENVLFLKILGSYPIANLD